MNFRKRAGWLLSTLAVLFLAMGLVAPFAEAGLTPGTNTLTIPAGSSGTETKTITVPAKPALADVEIAIDTTGSMGPAIAQAKAEALALVAGINLALPGASVNYAVVDFKDKVDGAAEYVIRQAFTNNAALVQTAINAMSASGGGDNPEAHNLVFNKAYTDATIGWRAGARKFVIVISDAQPHGAGSVVPALTGCNDTIADPNGLNTNTELGGMNTNQRTLFMVYVPSSIATLQCYQSIAAKAFTGSAAITLGASLTTQITTLITAATSGVNNVHLEVQTPNPNASWVSFSPANFGPIATLPATLTDTVTVNVPPGTVPGTYTFTINALADGANVGSQTLTVIVPVPAVESCDHPTAAQLAHYRPLGDTNGNPNGSFPLGNLIDTSNVPNDQTMYGTFWAWTDYARAVALQVNYGAGSASPVLRTVSKFKIFSHDLTKAPNVYFQFSQNGTLWYDIPGLNMKNVNFFYGYVEYTVSPKITAQYFRAVIDNTTYINDVGYWADLVVCSSGPTGAATIGTHTVSHQLPITTATSPQVGSDPDAVKDGLSWTGWQVYGNPASASLVLDMGANYKVTGLDWFQTNSAGPNSTKIEVSTTSDFSSGVTVIANGINTGGYNYGLNSAPAFAAATGRYVRFSVTNTSSSWGVGGLGDVKLYGYLP